GIHVKSSQLALPQSIFHPQIKLEPTTLLEHKHSPPPSPVHASMKKGGNKKSTPGGAPERKKRKLRSNEETYMLLKGIQEFGRGNWAAILNANPDLHRTASQLSQRWSAVKRKVQQGKSDDTKLNEMVEEIVASTE